MTLREESVDGPPAKLAPGAGPPETASPPEQAEPPEQAGPPSLADPPRPAARPQPAAPGAAEGHPPPAGPGPGTGLAPPGGPAQPAPAAGPPPAAGPAPTAGPDHPAHLAGSSLAAPSRPGGPGRPRRRRRSRGAILIGGSAAICLIGLGSFAAFLLLHARAHATAAALPAVFQLRPGECVDSGPGGVSSPTVVPCGQPHDAEIYARFGLAGRRWPGTAAIGVLARQGCTARLGGYLNPQLATTVLAESYVFPDQGAWNAGERIVICEIRGTTGKLTGSVRGLG